MSADQTSTPRRKGFPRGTGFPRRKGLARLLPYSLAAQLTIVYVLLALAAVSLMGIATYWLALRSLGHNIGDLNLALLAEAPQAAAYAPARQLGWTIFLIGLGMVSLTALGAYLLARRAARPVAEITAIAQRVANGQAGEPSSVFFASAGLPAGSQAADGLEAHRAPGDEYDQLRLSFYAMAARLQEAYETLQASETRFRTLIEDGADLILSLDRQGVVQYASPSLERLLGYRLNDWLGQPVFAMIHPDDRERARLRFQQVLRNETEAAGAPLEVRLAARNPAARNSQGPGPGEQGWRIFEITGARLLHPEAAPAGASLAEEVVINGRDVTERRQAEAALQQANRQLEILRQIDCSLLEAESPHAIAAAALQHIQELAPCQQASVIVFDEQAGRAIVLASSNPEDPLLRAGEDFDLAQFDLQRILNGQVELIPDLAQLFEPPVVSQAPYGAGSIPHQLYLAGLRCLLNAPLMGPGGAIGSFSLGANQPEAFDDRQIEIARELADRVALAINQANLQDQIRQHTLDLEERILLRTRELEERNRSMETFTYSVSHDLKAPLRGIDGYSRLLEQGYADRLDDEGRLFLENIRQAASQMHQLISDLLDYSRLERRSIQPARVELPEVVQSVLTALDGSIHQSRAEIRVDLQCHVMEAEFEGLSQALRNLVDNAIKFSAGRPQPRIEIGSRCVPAGQGLPPRCQMWVKDNGIGFDMQYHDRIFEIFQRLQRAEDYPGTGVGLALVYKVAERLGGRVWAESQPGAGATFYLEIPL